MNELTSLILKTKQCNDCKGYFSKLFHLFTNNIGFKDVCDKCKKKRIFFYDKGLAKFPGKKEFMKTVKLNLINPRG